MPTGIQWTELPGWPGYIVSDDGQIRGPRGMRRVQESKDGHLYVHLYRRGSGRYGSGRSTKVWVHRAVLEAFVGPCLSGQESRHLDDDPSNNHLSNLIWGTRIENFEDRRRNGRIPLGELSASAKLTQDQVCEIRRRRPTETARSLGEEFGVSHTTILKLTSGKSWSHI